MPLQISGQGSGGQREVWVAQMDENTCPECRGLHGQTFAQGEGPQPPLHPGGRCSRQPVGGGGPGAAGGGIQPGGGPSPIKPLMEPGGGPIQPLTPRRAIPQTGLMQRIQAATPGAAPAPSVIAPPSGLPGTVVGAYGSQTLVAPPEPVGGVPFTVGGRQVGSFVGGEFVGAQRPSAMGPAARPERIQEMVDLRREAKQMTPVFKGLRQTVSKFWEQMKGVTGEKPGEGLGPRAGLQARLARQFAESRQRFAAAGWRDPYSGAAGEMQAMTLQGREAGGVVTPTRRPGLPGMIARQLAPMQQQLQELAPRGRDPLQGALFGMMAMRRAWGMTAGTLGKWSQEFGAYDLSAQQAQFAMGEAPQAGAYQEQQQARAGMANVRTSLGQAAWQNFGFLAGAVGQRGVQPGPLQHGATLALGLSAPWAMSRLGSGALAMMGSQTGAGLLAGAAPMLAMGGAALGGVAAGGGGANWLAERLGGVEGYEPVEGLGGTLGRLGQIGKQGLFLGGRALAGGLRRLGLGPQDEEGWLENQKWVYERMFREGGGGAGGAGAPSPLETLSAQQQEQLKAQLAGMTGGAAPQRLMETLATQAPMQGFDSASKFLTQLERTASQMGAMPGSQQMVRLLETLAGAGRTELAQAQAAAGTIGQFESMFGAVPGGDELGFAQTYAEMEGPERRRLGQFLGGNRQVWSDLGRKLGGREDWITQEAGGLPIYTQELRGLQDESTQQQRGYRDWKMQQQWSQMQATQAYTRAGWGVQDQTRALQGQRADWQYGMQQQQFQMAGAQFQQRFDMSGRQWQESFALGQQMFEARTGWQQQDFGQQQQRAATQYGWQMEDWSHSENVSQLQAGWRSEDLSEQIRFSSGRRRKQLQQTAERSTIMESMRRQQHEKQKSRIEQQREWQTEGFEKAKERNEQLVELQRSRFEMQLRHHDESRAQAQLFHDDQRRLQRERMEKTREFFLKARELEDQRIKMQRQHWEDQQKWAESAWAMAKKHNAQMDKLSDATRDLQRKQQDVVANFSRMLTYAEEFSSAIGDAMAGLLESPQQARERHEVERGHQAGGPVFRPEVARLGESGEEYVVPSHGALVMREDQKSVSLLTDIYNVLIKIAEINANGEQAVVVVQTPNAEKAREHVLSLEDGAWGLMPS